MIVDTGALVAYLNANEARHGACLDVVKNFQGTFVSTEAVLTEALYLLSSSFEVQAKCLELFAGTITLVPTPREKLGQIKVLMHKYQNLPMDYADATLVALAEDLECGEVFTLDRRGFEAYRWGRNRVFKIYPTP